MADLERHAIKRDKRFIVRLVLGLAAAIVVGSIIFMKMTSVEFGGCAAGAFGTVSDLDGGTASE